MGVRHTHLRLDIDLDGEPIVGEIRCDGAEPRVFTGYASLIAAIHSLRDCEPDPADRPSDEHASA